MIIEEFCEFTWDMVRGLPRTYHCYANKIPCEVRCKAGLVSLYRPFCDKVTGEKKFKENGPEEAETYLNHRPSWTQGAWLPPPLKQIWKGKLEFEKPVLVIQNKYTIEWCQGIFNYFPVDVLEQIFEVFQDSHTIIYIRPRGKEKNYFRDDNKIVKFEDYKQNKRKFRSVLTIEDFWWKLRKLDFNQRQFAIHACADRHISVSGGNACLAAYFGGDLIMFDSPEGQGAGRGVWKTDSWLSLLGGSRVYGFNEHKPLVNKAIELWA
jgi:hypothetical protein